MIIIDNQFDISELYISDLLSIMYDYSSYNTKESFIDYMNNIREQYEKSSPSTTQKIDVSFSTTRKSFLEWMNGVRKPSSRNLNVSMCRYIFDDIRFNINTDYSALISLLQVLKNHHVNINDYQAKQRELSLDKTTENNSLAYRDLLDNIIENMITVAFNNGNNKPHKPTGQRPTVFFTETTDISFMRKTIVSKLFPGEYIQEISSPLTGDNTIITRNDIIKKIQKFDLESCKITLITGFPGSGKSTFLKYFVSNFSSSILANFFCQWDTYRKNSISRVIKNLAFQLQKTDSSFCIQLYKQINSLSVDAICSMTEEELFDNIIFFPLKKTHISSQKYIVLDAIDELDDASILIHALEKCVLDLPDKLKLIVSSRNTLNLSFNPKYYNVIQIDRDVSLSGIRDYLSLRLSNVYHDETIDALAQKCGSNYLFAKFLCDDLLNGIVSITQLPSGLEYIYLSYFQRAFSKVSFTDEYRKALSIIIAAKENISLNLLSDILKWNHSVAYEFSKLLGNLIDDTNFPQQIEFYHKSIDDWLKSSHIISEFQIHEQQGIDLIFEYILYAYNHGLSIPYAILKDWEYYGKRANNRRLFELLFEDVDFILEVIKQERQHCDFEKAFSIINSNILITNSENYMWFMMHLALNDIFIDLSDKRMFISIDTLLNKTNLIPDDAFYIQIHLYENAGWIYMQSKNYSNSNYYFEQALNSYKSIPASIDKKANYAHTLYLYSVSLYRQQNFDKCKKILSLSQSLISQTINPKVSFDYSLGLKMLGWLAKKEKNINGAREYFLQALNIQIAILNNNNTFLAHTYYCLSEIEYQLYEQQHDISYANDSLEHVTQAKSIYILYEASYHNLICKLNELERKLVVVDFSK